LTKKLILFLLPFGLSVVSLSMLEFFADQPVYRSIFGSSALVGASLVVLALPAFAFQFDPTSRRRKISRGFFVSGLALAALNVLTFFLPALLLGGLVHLATIVALGLAVSTAMSWIDRGQSRWEAKAPSALMPALFIGFGLAFAVDLLRGFIPSLSFLGDHYLFFPGFYAFLNIYLFYSHVRVWAKALREEGKEPEVAPADADCLKRFGISEREAEVLAFLARGRTYREIADSLFISLATIKTHVSHLYEKTGTRNKIELLNATGRRIGRSDDSSPQPGESTH
jgi:DNA-binding CsgD family transcriptional regulator